MSNRSDPSVLFQEAKASLASEITRAVESSDKAASKPKWRLIRAEARTTPVEPLAWLGAQGNLSKVYWADRDKPVEIAGVGESDALSSDKASDGYEKLFTPLCERLNAAPPTVRYYGGSRFNAQGERDAEWLNFGTFRLILPRFELIRRDGECTLACNVVLKGADPAVLDATLAELNRLRLPPGGGSAPLPNLQARVDTPDTEGWRRSVNRALESFDEGTLQKIVLARRSLLQFAGDLEPTSILKRLKAVTPHCYHFCLTFGNGATFIGASPERLYRRRGERIWSEAIAGTRPRGDSSGSDERIGNNLLQSEKDLREHEFVVRGIQESLSGLCGSLEVDGRLTLLKLTQCQHLASLFYGHLKPGVRDIAILTHLQPTPAVGGYPTASTLEILRHIEPFDRGWYAGPVGWIAADAAEFAVAIRSGLVVGQNLFLYSGAGIVRGSNAEEEWEELENKISPFLQVVGRP